MRHILLIAAMALSVTGVHAQTVANGGGLNVGVDPLSVPTSTLPALPSIPSRAVGSGTAIAAGGSTADISAPSSDTSQVPLQLPGERPGTSTQAATSTAAAAGQSSGAICPPPVPTSDGGSANVTEMVGGSLGGC